MVEHIPVMPREVIKFLALRKNENIIDATCGFGGHSKLILANTAPRGQLLAIDQDIEALDQAKRNLMQFKNRVSYINKNFSELGLIIRFWPVENIHGILLDLGVSTYQLTSDKRGFSFNQDSVLDMRMAPNKQRLTAKEIVNSWDKKSIKKILLEYGEEPYAGRIAHQIIWSRKHSPIIRTDQLVEVIKKAMPPKYRFSREKHFATSTFRALRMAVNDELSVLENGLKQAVQIISPGGRIVVISFHSLEDRVVKNFFASNDNLKILTSKPVIASEEEVKNNPKARSAKLRAALKIG